MDRKNLVAAQDALVFQDDVQDQQLTVQIAGTFVGTVTFEVSLDRVTWTVCSMEPLAGGAAVTTATAPGIWKAYPFVVPNTGLNGLAFRARCSAYTSGTINVYFQPVKT